MRLLVYGGCHAEVLTNVLRDYCLETDFAVSDLINYQIIGRNEPFPYDRLDDYDAVAYSPIVNQGDWNTSFLKAACEDRNIQTVCFPWLEWHGYYPTVGKRISGQSGIFYDWFYTKLFDEASRWESFEQFVEAVCHGDALCEGAEARFNQTTERLVAAEQTQMVDIPVSSFIMEHYQTKRLFVTPDHPAPILYFWVAQEIAKRLGLRLDPCIAFASEDLQAVPRMPILPSVGRVLGLKFADASAREISVGNGKWLRLRDYLAIYYYAKPHATLYRAREGAVLTTDQTGVSTSWDQPAGTEIIAELIDGSTDRSRLSVHIVLRNGVPTESKQIWLLAEDQWIRPAAA